MKSMFQLPGLFSSADWSETGTPRGGSLPREFEAAFGMMANPASGMLAMSAFGFGLASHALGVWAGALAGSAQASQRLFLPLEPRPAAAPADAPAATASRAQTASAEPIAFARKPRPALKAVPPVQPAPAPVAAETVTPVSQPEPMPKASAKPVEAPAVAAGEVPAAAPALRKPAPLARPQAPDDLKAISGIGPKLEKVLNDLGVWTYAQIAEWSAEEIGWVDDYLGFRGRIGRDGWIGQAAGLAGRDRPAE